MHSYIFVVLLAHRRLWARRMRNTCCFVTTIDWDAIISCGMADHLLNCKLHELGRWHTSIRSTALHISRAYFAPSRTPPAPHESLFLCITSTMTNLCSNLRADPSSRSAFPSACTLTSPALRHLFTHFGSRCRGVARPTPQTRSCSVSIFIPIYFVPPHRQTIQGTPLFACAIGSPTPSFPLFPASGSGAGGARAGGEGLNASSSNIGVCQSGLGVFFLWSKSNCGIS